MFSNDACNNYSIVDKFISRWGESEESKVLYLEEWNGGKIRVQGLKWLNTYTRMCLCIEERGILE